MTIDPEQRFITECAKIAGLETNVKSIKSSIKKLSKKLDELQIQGFYDQIAALDKKITELKENLLSTQYLLAIERIEIDELHLLEAARLKLSKSDPNNYLRVKEHILIEYTKAEENIKNSEEPLRVSIKFRKHCADYSKEQNLGAFRD